MKSLFALCCFVLLAVVAFAQQSIKQYVKQNTVRINAISADSTDYTDLEALGNAIGDARIVMLGEQDHGDAPAFIAKARLIQYLHEQKGFNVVAFESDFFGLNTGWDALQKDSLHMSQFLAANIFTIWTTCDACFPFFYNYVPATWQTQHPLQISGFDSQMYLGYSLSNLSQQLDSLLKALRISSSTTTLQDPVKELFSLITGSASIFKKNRDELIEMLKDTARINLRGRYFAEVNEQLKMQLPATDYWLRVMENLIQLNQSLVYGMEEWSDDFTHADRGTNARDEQMALNLKWLMQVKYPNEKIIVWAHNFHISKPGIYEPEWYFHHMSTMGRYFTEDTALVRQTYVLGFSSYEGEAGRIGPPTYTLPKPVKQSLEKWVNPRYDYAFIDFTAFSKLHGYDAEPFYMAGSLECNHEYRKAQWTQIFDGIFFVRNMYPCGFRNPFPPKE